MDSTMNQSQYQPKTIAELLPALTGILDKDEMQTIKAKTVSRTTMAQSRTAEKSYKPLTMAEMRVDLLALTSNTKKPIGKAATSTKKRNWNSSVKMENKTKSFKEESLSKRNSVRKVLNFQSKATPKPVPKVAPAETPKFPKPEFRPKKSVHFPAKNTRISGICSIQETPVITKSVIKTQTTAGNKENLYRNNFSNKQPLTKPVKKNIYETLKTVKSNEPRPITPLSNVSFKSGSDASFLQKEKEINEFEEKSKVGQEQPMRRITEASPPVSTPFKDYRSIHEFFNDSNNADNSALYNDTIMCFDNTDTNKREDSVIVSLCDLLNKATVSTKNNVENNNAQIQDLHDFEKQTQNNIKILENAIMTLTTMKESQLKSLEYVRKLIREKNNENKTITNTNVTETKTDIVVVKEEIIEEVPSRPSVIKRKSLTYKIPKKNNCLRKKAFSKSVLDVSNTSKECENKALDMYMQMKQNMNFLNTPVAKRNYEETNTPAVTSRNLQKQLDKLFNCS